MKTLIINILIFLIVPIFLINCSKNDPLKPEIPEPTDEYEKVTIQIDQERTYQVIDGFGFFGAHDVWWGNASDLWNEAWGEMVISDLGITIWRNEIYPPDEPNVIQDADWNKQLPVVRGLKKMADKHNVSLKFVASVWSPPADFKWAVQSDWPGDTEATRWEDPGVSTKNGGTLNPNKYPDFASWLNNNLGLYKSENVEMYALSLQNEPVFSQSFNSCEYTVYWYNDLLVNVVPPIKSEFPEINIYGVENMLEMEGKEENWPWFYHSAIKDNSAAATNLDILAVHGYSDGILPTSGSDLVQMWNNHTKKFAVPMNKKVWMTETSGYFDIWESKDDKPGALNLGLDIITALNYGNISAWIWWQGSGLDGIDEYNLMKGVEPSRKYFVSKHFYRFIRPGAVRIYTNISSDDEDVFVTAFKHDDNKTFTIVIANVGEAKSVSIQGKNLPDEFVMYRSNETGEDKCSLIESIQSGDDHRFVLPRNAIITLQAGGDPL